MIKTKERLNDDYLTFDWHKSTVSASHIAQDKYTIQSELCARQAKENKSITYPGIFCHHLPYLYGNEMERAHDDAHIYEYVLYVYDCICISKSAMGVVWG